MCCRQWYTQSLILGVEGYSESQLRRNRLLKILLLILKLQISVLRYVSIENYPLGLWNFRRLCKTANKAISCVRSVCLSFRHSHRNNSNLNGQTFKQFDIRVFFLKSFESFQLSLKSGKSNEKFTWRPMYIYCYSSLNSSWKEKCFGQHLCKKPKPTFNVQQFFPR
jgi:hypothetical protein